MRVERERALKSSPVTALLHVVSFGDAIAIARSRKLPTSSFYILQVFKETSSAPFTFTTRATYTPLPLFLFFFSQDSFFTTNIMSDFCTCPATIINGQEYTDYSQFYGSVFSEWYDDFNFPSSSHAKPSPIPIPISVFLYTVSTRRLTIFQLSSAT